MHIAFNGWFWNRPDTGSGQYTRELLNALQDGNPELQIGLVIPAHYGQLDEPPSGAAVIPVRLPIGGHLGKIWFEQIGFPRAAGNAAADLIHIPYWAPPLTSPVPVIATIHDIIPLSMPVYQGGFMARLYTSLVAAGARGAAHILTDSEASRQEIIDHLSIPANQITVAALAADKRFHPKHGAEDDEAVRERYDLPERFGLYLGGYDIRKNVHTLLLAWTYVAQAMATDVPLVLAGRQPTHWGTDRFPDLPAYIDKLELAPFVHWTGEIAEADKPALYRLAEVMVFPSRYEGFGLPPLEAMACGTPVVACEVSSIPEIVGDAAFLVGPDDAREMGGAILGVLLQPPLVGQLRNLGLERARMFSWHQTAATTLAVYRSVLANTESA